MATENNHFISRFLTKPWEFSERRLRYFEFDSGKFDWDSSDNVFAKEKIYSQKIEDFLNKYVETPFSKFRNSIVGNPDNSIIRQYNVLRAIYLMHSLQALRVSAISSLEARSYLETLAEKDEPWINGLVEAMRPKSQIMVINPLPREFLCVPDIGFFCMWLKDKACVTGHSIGWFIPMHPQFALGILSDTVDQDYLAFLRKQPGLISAASTSFSPEVKRLVLPEDVYQHYDKIDLAQRLMERRRLQQENNKLHLEIRENVKKMYAMAGLYVRQVPQNRFGITEVLTPDQWLAAQQSAQDPSGKV